MRAEVAAWCVRGEEGRSMTPIETPKPQAGTWTLTAPDGRTWQADSPLRCVSAEMLERVPASVQMARIWAAVKDES